MQSDRWNSEVESFLEGRFANAPVFGNSVLRLWRDHLARGLANAHFVKELTNGKQQTFSQRLWEMLLGAHLSAQGFVLFSPEHGPDFRFESDGLTIWVEAVSPEPKGLPPQWMRAPKSGEFLTGDVPHDQILLRWTAAFKEKAEKLARYRKDGIVRDGEAYVIAIGGAQLGAMPLDHGISRLPYVVEAVLPVGPLAFLVDRDTGKIGGGYVSERFAIRNANGSPVATTPFVDPAYASVSAAIGFSRDRADGSSLPMYAVQNPLARVPIARGTFGPSVEEWWGVPVGTTGEFMDLEHSIVRDG
ncbi:hypothetical protein [Bradyrhizobium liaoningense]|uniref:hypothetical protein n=1 Tax=Bradyrhizobium liaoningense TaxID=43992 RepID=UPI001BACA365|nr:hypothetical protein [Bradyrhizobium liaoningense]MBR1030304.1 hypothetical protein [Bradyrhizobium liaoningense]